MSVKRRCAICTNPIRHDRWVCNKCWKEWDMHLDENKNLICADWIHALIEEEWRMFLLELKDQRYGIISLDDPRERSN